MAPCGCGGADMTKKVALFGGTFDPVHIGHLVCARRVAESGGFDRIILVPAARPPHKDTALASAEDRLNMLRLAVEGDAIFEICEIELHRTGPSYTFDTLVEMRDKFGPDVSLHWLIGADMLEQLHTWHRAVDVVQMAKIVTMARPPWQRRLSHILEALTEHLGPQQVLGLRNSVVQTPLLDICSTEIRDRVRRGLSVRFLVPEAVFVYIEKHRLYRDAGDG